MGGLHIENTDHFLVDVGILSLHETGSSSR